LTPRKERGKKKKEGLPPFLDAPGKAMENRFTSLAVVYLYTGDHGMEQTFEATIEKRNKWYIGWVDAVPGAFSQGRTIKEVEENLKEAVQLILESQRELRDRGGSGEILKRRIQVQV